MSITAKPKKSWLAYYSELLAVWAKRSNTPQDAEDAVQDAALTMLESDTMAVQDHHHYLHRMVANRSVSLYRAAQVRVAQHLDDLPEDMHPATESAEDVCVAGDLARIMMAALHELPASCQTAFRLRQEGLNNSEIALSMGVTRNMVERYMMRTIRHLQDQLQKHGH